MIMNSTKQCLKLLSIKKKRISIMITSVSAYVNVSYFFSFLTFLNVRIYSSFRFLRKRMSALRLITSNSHQVETFSAKREFCVFIITNQQKSGNENLKKILCNCIIDTGSKMPRRLESKSSGAFNFLGFIALKLCNNSHDIIMKMTQHVTSQTKRKNNEKQK